MYGIEISFPSDNEVVIVYPEDNINNIPVLKKSYKIENSSILINGGSTKFPCPEYSHRILIFFDIMINVWRRKLHHIDFLYQGLPTKNIKKLIRENITFDKQYLDQEKRLLKSVLTALVEENTVKVDKDVVYGYELILELIACGGINKC